MSFGLLCQSDLQTHMVELSSCRAVSRGKADKSVQPADVIHQDLTASFPSGTRCVPRIQEQRESRVGLWISLFLALSHLSFSSKPGFPHAPFRETKDILQVVMLVLYRWRCYVDTCCATPYLSY